MCIVLVGTCHLRRPPAVEYCNATYFVCEKPFVLNVLCDFNFVIVAVCFADCLYSGYCH